jgi:hypothetical protein
VPNKQLTGASRNSTLAASLAAELLRASNYSVPEDNSAV